MKKFIYQMFVGIFLLAIGALSGCKENKEDTPEPEPEPTAKATLSIDKIDELYNGATVTMTVKSADFLYHTYYLKGKKPATSEIDWTEVQISADGEQTVTLVLPPNAESRTLYTFEAYAVKGTEKTDYKTFNFQTPKAEPVSAEILGYSPTNALIKVSMIEELCQGFCWAAIKTSEWNEEAFLGGCIGSGEYFYPDYLPVTEAGEVQVEYLDPDTDYTLAIVPVNVKKSEFGEVSSESFAGAVVRLPFHTRKYEANISTVKAVISLNGEADFASVPVRIKAEEGCKKYFLGAAKKSDVGTLSIDTYINASDWFFTKIDEYTYNYQTVRPFIDAGTWEPTTELTASATGLAQNTDYIVFAIGVDSLGNPGKVTSIEARTSVLSFDSPATVQLDVTNAGFTDYTFNVTLKGGCQKAYYLVYQRGQMDEETARDALLGNLEWGDYWGEDGEQTLYNLYMGATYDLYILPVDAAGHFGEIVKVEFTTSTPSYDGNATVTVNVGPATGEGYMKEATASILKGDNCASFIYLSFAKETVTEANPSAKDEDYANYLLTCFDKMTSEEDMPEFVVDLFGADYVLVVIPIDAEGKNGKPVVTHIPFN